MRTMHGRRPHAGRWLIARVLLVLLTVLPPSTVLFAGSPAAWASSTATGYTTTLTSPTPPVAAST